MSQERREFERNLKLILHEKIINLERNLSLLKEELEFLKVHLVKFHHEPERFNLDSSRSSFLAEMINETMVLKESIDRMEDAALEDTLPLIRYTCYEDAELSSF